MTTYVNPGLDASGNGNNWTTENINWTTSSSTTYDVMTDVPTLTSATAANFCTLNPLSATSGTFSNANLQYVGPSSTRRANSTIAVSTGKWYWEVTLTNAPESPRSSTTAWNAFGFGLSTTFGSTAGTSAGTDALFLADNGYYKNFSGAWTDSGVGFANGDVLAIAVDLDANSFTFYKNNTSIVTGTIGGTAGRELTAAINSYAGTYGTMACNFGQRPFAYTPPSGYNRLQTYNLPTPTIGASSTTLANKYFDATTYTGTSGSPANQSITSLNFQPDFGWWKKRSAAYDHCLIDSVRGVTKQLYSNLTNAEGTDSAPLVSFDSNGFTVGNSNYTNYGTQVAWCWKAGGATGSSNTSGSITSTVSANTTAGFSIVTYTSTTGTVGHGLGVAPDMIIMKGRNVSDQWTVGHKSLNGGSSPWNYGIPLNTSSGTQTNSGFWNNTAPTSTVFSQGSWDSGYTKVAYCFTAIAGFSSFGSYTGNGSTDGPFVFCGFRPKYVLIKRIDATGGDWAIQDGVRNPYNASISRLWADLSNAETDASNYGLDLVSNGFKLRNTNVDTNASSVAYIYMAFAEFPLKYSNAR